MKAQDFYSGLFLLGVSTAACIVASRLGLGNINEPGAGLIPFGVAAILGLMSIGMIIGNLLETNQRDKGFDEGISLKKPTLVLCTLLGYGIALNTLGFAICTFLLMLVFLGVIARRKWWLTLATSIFTVVGAYLVFVALLGVQLPIGPFGR